MASLRYLIVACGIYNSMANLEIFTQRFSADPAPLVIGDRVYIYTSHDTNTQTGYYMIDYNCFSSDDLVNWRDEGIVFSILNQSWGMYAWAQQVIFNPHTQLYTMFYPGMNARAAPASNATGTGVATSASPTGPFNDALGYPILPCGDDPTVFIDDDGTIILCGKDHQVGVVSAGMVGYFLLAIAFECRQLRRGALRDAQRRHAFF